MKYLPRDRDLPQVSRIVAPGTRMDEGADEGWNEQRRLQIQNGWSCIKHGNVLIYWLLSNSFGFTCVIYGRDGCERHPYVVLHSTEAHISIGAPFLSGTYFKVIVQSYMYRERDRH